MRIISLSCLLALTSSVFADVTFNVIGFPDDKTNMYAVEINKKLHPLKTSKDTFPLWSANVADASASDSYRYVQLNKKKKVVSREEFQRQFDDEGATATLNEFFNRQTTITALPEIKQVYEDIRPTASEAFDSSQIATINLTTDKKAFDEMLDNPLAEDREPIDAGFRFINTDNVYSAGNVKLKVSGHGSRKYKKVSLSIAFDAEAGETFFDRPEIKLRAEYIDPTMIREKLYVDLLNAVGVASYQGSYVRVYVNGKPQGLYLMVEDVSEPFLMNTIHHGAITDKKHLGALFKMSSGLHATMQYKGRKTADYDPVVYTSKIQGDNPKDDPMKQFIGLMRDLQGWDPTAAGGVAFWKERLDLDSFLRSMSLEYLTGAWDQFWWRGNNYYMYFNPEKNIWQFIPNDFDNTFSIGTHPDVDTTYKNYARFRLKVKSKDIPLVTKLIYKNKDINKEFEKTLLTITNGVFNNKAVDARIDAYKNQIEEDVAWDLSIDRSKLPGIDLEWNIETFNTAFKDPVKRVGKGLKTWIGDRAKSVPKQVRKGL
ncbi:hypothetical protein BG005_010235 [Podila minutissima]|nr:hypothetical protein BG005_010235 [Podila minutissima]